MERHTSECVRKTCGPNGCWREVGWLGHNIGVDTDLGLESKQGPAPDCRQGLQRVTDPQQLTNAKTAWAAWKLHIMKMKITNPAHAPLRCTTTPCPLITPPLPPPLSFASSWRGW